MVSTKEDFMRYIAYFNNKDYEPQHDYYADNVEFTLPNLEPMYGSAAIRKHYDVIHELADETLDVLAVLFDKPTNPTKIFFENYSWFRFKRDHKHHDPVEAKKDDLAKITVWIVYELDSAQKFKKITCTALKKENLGTEEPCMACVRDATRLNGHDHSIIVATYSLVPSPPSSPPFQTSSPYSLYSDMRTIEDFPKAVIRTIIFSITRPLDHLSFLQSCPTVCRAYTSQVSHALCTKYGFGRPLKNKNHGQGWVTTFHKVMKHANDCQIPYCLYYSVPPPQRCWRPKNRLGALTVFPNPTTRRTLHRHLMLFGSTTTLDAFVDGEIGVTGGPAGVHGQQCDACPLSLIEGADWLSDDGALNGHPRKTIQLQHYPILDSAFCTQPPTATVVIVLDQLGGQVSGTPIECPIRNEDGVTVGDVVRGLAEWFPLPISREDRRKIREQIRCNARYECRPVLTEDVTRSEGWHTYRDFLVGTVDTWGEDIVYAALTLLGDSNEEGAVCITFTPHECDGTFMPPSSANDALRARQDHDSQDGDGEDED